MRFGVLTVAVAATLAVALLAGCDQIPVSDRYGQIIPVNGLPPNCVAYVLKAGDTMFSLAEMFYGKDSKYYLIYNANKTLIDTHPEMWKAGTVIIIPPDFDGRPVNSKSPQNYR